MVAAGCATPATNKPTAADQTDVWFMQHMVPHLRQTNSIVDLARDRITRSKLTRLADTIGHMDKPTFRRRAARPMGEAGPG